MKSSEKVRLAVLLAAIISSANVTGNASNGSAVLNSINNNLTGSNIREDLLSPRAVSADSVKTASAGQTTIMQDDFKITSMKLADDGKAVGMEASNPIQSSVNTVANSSYNLMSVSLTEDGDKVIDGSSSSENLSNNVEGNVITKNGGTANVEEGVDVSIKKGIQNGEDEETSEPKSSFNNKGSVTVGENVTNNGIFKNGDETTESPAGRAKLTLSSGKLDNKGTFNNQGLLDIGTSGGSESDEERLNNSGTFTNGEKGTVTTYGGKNTNSGTFTNSGGFNGTSSKFDNEKQGNLTNSGNFKAGTMTNKGEITNNAKDGHSFQAGSLDNQAGGKVKNQEGADMTVFGELQNLTEESSGTGEDDGITNSGNLKAGKVTNGGNITNTGSGSITVEGTSSLGNSDGSLTNNAKGSITNEDGGTITVKGQTTNSSSGKDGKGGINNQGTFNAEGGLDNKAGGKITNGGTNGNFQVGTDGTEPKGNFTNAGEVDNQKSWTTYGTTTNSGTLTSSGTYQANGDVNNSGNLTNSGTFNSTGNVENSGNLNNSSTFSVGKNFTNSGTGDGKGVTNSGSFSILDGTFTNSGDFTNTGNDGQLTLQGALKNETGGNLTNTSGASVEITGDITNNNGSITNDTDSSFSVSGNVSNSGSGSITNKSKKAGDKGGMSITGSLTNNGGTVNNEGGTLDLTGDLTNTSGEVKNTTGGTFSAGGTVTNGGTITNDGASTFDAKGKVTNNNGGNINNKNGSKFTAEDEVDNSGTITNDGTDSTFDAKKKVTNKDKGNINNTNDATFNAENGLDNQTGAKVTNSGNVEVSKGSGDEPALNNQGSIDNKNTWTTNGETKNSGNLNNSGTYNAKGKVTNEESGTLENSGSFFATGDVENKGNLNNSLTFDVEGTFTNSGKGPDKGVTNSGTFSVNGDSFTNSGDFTNNGESGQLTLQGALKNETGGNLTNQDGASVSVTGTSTNKGNITNTGDGTEFGALGGFANGEDGENGTITNSDGASFNITGELKNENGSNITNEGEGSTFSASNTVNNNGTITNKTKKSGEKGGMSLGNVTNNGTINNEGGSLDAESLTNGTIGVSANQGTVQNSNGGDFNVNGELKNQKGSITNSGSGSTFNAKGKVTNGAEGGSSEDASITNSNGATFNAENEVENSGTITNDGTGSTFDAKKNVTNKNGGKIDNKNHGSFNADGGLTNENSGSTVTNDATSTFSVGTEDSNAELQNSGNIDNKGFWTTNGETKNSGTLDNSGTYNATGKVTNDESGTLENSGSFSATNEVENSGNLNNSSTFGVGGNFTNSATGDDKGVTNSGTFSVNGETFTNKGNFTNTGDDGQLTVQNALRNETGGNLTNKDGANVEIGSVENNGKITNEANSDMTFNGKVTGGSSDSGNITNSGNLTLNGDASGYTGGFTQNGGTANVEKDSKFFGGTSSVSGGTLDWKAAEDDSVDKLTMSGGNLHIENAGKLTLGGSSSIAGEVNAQIDQDSELVVKGSGDDNKSKVELGDGDTWNGKVTLDGGELDITKDFFGSSSFSGSLEAKSGKLGLDTDFTVGPSSSIKKAVDVEISEGKTATVVEGGSLELDDKDTWKGTVDVEGGSLTLTGDFTNGEGGADKNGKLTASKGEVKFGSSEEPKTKFDITEDSSIAKAVQVTVEENTELTIKDGGSLDIDNDEGSADTWKGTVKLDEGGTLNFWNKQKEGESNIGDLEAKKGRLNLKNESYFDFTGDIEEAVELHIEKGSNLHVGENATLKLNGKSEDPENKVDEWSGTIVLDKENSSLEADNVTNSGSAVLKQSNGKSTFTNGSDITIAGDSEITGGSVDLKDKSRLTFGQGCAENADADFTVESGSTLSLRNGGIDSGNLENLTVDDHANFGVDLDPRHHHGDQFTFNELKQAAAAESGKSKLNVSEYDFVGGAPIDRYIHFQIFDPTKLGSESADKFEFGATDELKKTPIGWYGLRSMYNGPDDDPALRGWYQAYLARFNPQVFRGQVATLAMYSNQLHVDDMVTNHFILHDETLIDKSKNLNKYSAVAPLYSPYQRTYKEGGLWSKSYADIEKFNLTRGLNVRNDSYGTLLGADLPAVELNKDWTFIPTGYVGYNGARQSFEGVKMSQNGGQIGVMGTFIRNEDFITSVTAYGGGYTNEMQVEGFTDEPANWFAGASAKTAYNFEPVRDFILQPNLFMAYNAFGSRKWGTDYGIMDMNSGMLNAANVAPGLNMILSKETWSIYGTLQYMFFINDRVYGKAGNVELPDVRFEHGFIQYGIGATKTFKDTIAAYGQMNLRNGGITGIGFQLGLQWLFDMKNPFANHEKSKTTQVDTPHVKKYIQPKKTAYNKYMVKKTVRT